jgi:F-type H+-transporting ATPase subunit epsilon
MAYNLSVVTPSGVLDPVDISLLHVRSGNGDLTILPNHFPLVTNVTPSICYFDSTTKGRVYAFVGEGILQVQEKSVKLIVASFNLKDDIDIDRARKALDRANAYLSEASTNPNIDVERAKKALIRAEARIALWEGKVK